MASHLRREDEEGLMSTPKSPHFFKFVFDKSIQLGMLGIPRKFVKKYGNGMPSLALLRVPSGQVWQMEMWKSEGRVWFRKGWPEFAKYYSLRQGHLLVFRYDQHTTTSTSTSTSTSACNFHVSIFDKSASEIDYPLNIMNPTDDDDDDVKVSDSDSGDDHSLEILGEYPAPCKKRSMEKSPTQCPRPPKKLRHGLENGKQPYKRSSSSTSKEGFGGEGGRKPSQKIRRSTGKRWECLEQAKILNFRCLATNEKARAIHIANAFKSENPFFLAIIRHFNTSCQFSMGIPIDFARKFLVMTTTAEATLCLLDGKTWSVKYLHTTYNGRFRSDFRYGWREFALDNGLKVGDVCVFELLEGTKVSFKVIIHRVAKDANCYPSTQEVKSGVYGTKARHIELEKSKEPRSSRCSKQGCNDVSASEMVYTPIINPAAAAAAAVDDDKDSDYDSEDDRSLEILGEYLAPCKKRMEKSSVECPRPRKKLRIELENVKQQYRRSSSSTSKKGFGGEGELKPSQKIQRGTGKRQECLEQAKILSFRFLATNEKARVLHIANAFKSENPFFLAMIQGCNLSRPFHMGIPIGFARKFLAMTTTAEATLRLLDGETWSVKYVHTTYGHTRSGFRIGWREFALDNGLKVGDICVFELLKDTKVSFKVIIHRAAEGANCYPSRQANKSGAYGNGTKARHIKLEKSKEPRNKSCSKQRCNGGFKPSKPIQGVMDNGLECPQQAEILRSPLLTVNEMARALEIASLFKSENPFFLVVIQPSHLNKPKFRMGIPSNFVRNYLMKKLPLAEATLCHPDGKTWCVDYYLNTLRPQKPYAQFGHGLREFAMDNNLKAGDVCVFELINRPNILFQVAIHRNAVKVANLHCSKQEKRRASRVHCNYIESDLSIKTETCASGGDDDDDEAGNISSYQGFRNFAFPSPQGNINLLKHPYFKRVFQPSSLVKGSVDFPLKFIEKYLEPNEDDDRVQEVTLQVANRQWPAKLTRYPEFRQGKLSRGWIKFAKENSLKLGDVCVFELINALGNATFQVSILRHGV